MRVCVLLTSTEGVREFRTRFEVSQVRGLRCDSACVLAEAEIDCPSSEAIRYRRGCRTRQLFLEPTVLEGFVMSSCISRQCEQICLIWLRCNGNTE